MHGQSEMLGGEVREPVGSHLVADAEHIAQMLDGEHPLLLLLLEHRHGRGLGKQDRGSQIVGFDALLEELVKVLRGVIAEDVRSQAHEQVRARIEGGIGIGQIQPLVRGVRDRPSRFGQVGDVVEAEAELLGDERRLPL